MTPGMLSALYHDRSKSHSGHFWYEYSVLRSREYTRESSASWSIRNLSKGLPHEIGSLLLSGPNQPSPF